jgi:hypothetical protein
MREQNLQSFGIMTNNPQTLGAEWLAGTGYLPAGPPTGAHDMWLQRYTLDN